MSDFIEKIKDGATTAFITLGGITPLLQTLKELEEKEIPGKVLTTDYNMFTDPKALDKLSYKGIYF